MQSTVIQALQVADAALALLSSVGINIARYQEMKTANDGEALTEDQLRELEAEAQVKLDRH